MPKPTGFANIEGCNLDRFWRNVDVRSPDACWLWTRSTRGSLGYGAVRIHRPVRRMESAHRVAFMSAHGPIPRTLQVLHVCDEPRCCNPAHLRLGTQQDNINDAISRNRARNGNIKLTRDQWDTIRISPEPTSTLARRHGVSEAHVRRIRRENRAMIRPEEN